jgi:hypothetical protein
VHLAPEQVTSTLYGATKSTDHNRRGRAREGWKEIWRNGREVCMCSMYMYTHTHTHTHTHKHRERESVFCESQQQVTGTLREMVLSVEGESCCPKSGYSIDMRVHDMPGCITSRSRASQGLRQGGQWNSTGFDVQVTSCWGLDEEAALVLLGWVS